MKESAPICHRKEMTAQYADDGSGAGVNFWECAYCGHAKEINQVITGA